MYRAADRVNQVLINPDDLKAELAAIEAESIGWQPVALRNQRFAGR